MTALDCFVAYAVARLSYGGQVAPRNDVDSVWSPAADELRQAILLRLLHASSFRFQAIDPLRRNRHGLGYGIVTVHRLLEREYELAVCDLVGAEFPVEKRDIVFVGAIIIGARRQYPGSQGRDVRVPLVDIIQQPADGISSKMQRDGGLFDIVAFGFQHSDI